MSEQLIEALRAHRADLCRCAAEADRHNAFPEQGVALLRQLGLLGAAVPEALGGLGLDLHMLARAASAIGAGCLSTALIWSMHSQQALTLASCAHEGIAKDLRRIAAQGLLIASVTSEYQKGGDIFKALAPLEKSASGKVLVNRSAPVVSYGAQADYFLMTMKASEQAPDNDVRFVLASRADGEVTIKGAWHAMGMRGTQSIPMRFQMTVDEQQVLPGQFRETATTHFVPAGQILWAASWLGAAQGLFERVIDEVAANRQEFAGRLSSELFVERVAAIRIQLLSGHAMLEAALGRCRSSAVPSQQLEADMLTWVNSLKVHVSELVSRLADDIMTLAGFARGYLTTSPAGVERVYRDLLSARLMFNNDLLRRSIGTHTLARHRLASAS